MYFKLSEVPVKALYSFLVVNSATAIFIQLSTSYVDRGIMCRAVASQLFQLIYKINSTFVVSVKLRYFV